MKSLWRQCKFVIVPPRVKMHGSNINAGIYMHESDMDNVQSSKEIVLTVLKYSGNFSRIL